LGTGQIMGHTKIQRRVGEAKREIEDKNEHEHE
jgi:hypothetical protein